MCRFLWKHYKSAVNDKFPRITRAQSFKLIWNVKAALIGRKVSTKTNLRQINIHNIIIVLIICNEKYKQLRYLCNDFYLPIRFDWVLVLCLNKEDY